MCVVSDALRKGAARETYHQVGVQGYVGVFLVNVLLILPGAIIQRLPFMPGGWALLEWQPLLLRARLSCSVSAYRQHSTLRVFPLSPVHLAADTRSQASSSASSWTCSWLFLCPDSTPARRRLLPQHWPAEPVPDCVAGKKVGEAAKTRSRTLLPRPICR